MSTLKRLTFFYFANLTIFIIVRTLFGGQLYYLITNVWVWVVPLFNLLVGQIIGFFSFILIDKKEQKAKIFYKCAVITCVGFVTVLFGEKLIDWNHQKNFGNIKSNEYYFKYFTEYKKQEKIIAFDTLLKKFKDPNDIKITGAFVHGVDTIIDNSRDTIYFLKLFYRKNNQDGNYKADFTIFKNAAHMNFYDKLLDQNDELRIDSISKSAKKNLEDALKDAPDSLKKIIHENFRIVLEH